MAGTPDLFNAYRKSLVAADAIWPAGDQVCELNHQISQGADLMGGLSQLATGLGFDYFSYTIGSAASSRPERALSAEIRSNYPCEWTSHYDTGNYTMLDPIVHYAKRARLPFLWGLEEDLACMPRSTREIMEECAGFGIRSGLAIPAHGPGDEFMLFSMCTSGGRDTLLDLFKRNYNLLWLLSPTVHAIAIKSWVSDSAMGDIMLTGHERECLYWTSQGKTSWEISRIIDRSQATVEYHLQKVMRKLSASTKGQAAATAMREGLL